LVIMEGQHGSAASCGLARILFDLKSLERRVIDAAIS